MKIDLSCPVEVWEASCPVPEREACSLKLFNLTDKNVNSVEINVSVTDKNGHELQHIIHRCYSLRGRPHSVFEAGAAMTYDSGAVRAEASVMKVWFDDNTVWRKSRDPLTDYTPNSLSPCRDLDMLQYVAGSSAAGFPEEQENVWLCVCGRPNGPETPVCARCQQTKERVFGSYNRDTIRDLYERKEHQLALRSRAVREDNARLQQKREEEYNLKTAKETGDRRLLIALGIAAVFALLLFFVGIPGLRVLSAVYGMDHGQAAEAEQVLTELRAFPGAEEQLARCRYLRAEQTLGSDNPEKLAEAAAIFREDGGEGTGELAMSADYERARLIMEQGGSEEAAEIFRALGDYRDSRDQTVECDYRTARGLFDSAFYGMALEKFSALGDYKDSVEKSNLCVYLPAAQLMENGEYDAAIAEYGKVADYSDSREQIKVCHWLKASSLEGTDPEAAAAAYEQAGDYADSKQKARALRYALGAEAETAGDLTAAAEQFRLAVPYEDALNRAYTCVYTLAEQHLTAEEYEAARELYATLPLAYRETEDRIAETRYRPAVTAQKNGDWQTAVTLFEALGEYKDGPSRLEKCRYELARSLQNGGRFEEAIPLYEALGEYSDSAKQLSNSRYDLAVRLAESGEYKKAAELFTALGNYKDSSTRLKDVNALLETAAPESTAAPADFAVEDE